MNDPAIRRISRPTVSHQLDADEARELAEALRENTTVSAIDSGAFSPSSLESSLDQLAGSLRENTAVKEIRLYRRQFRDRGAAAPIYDILRHNGEIRKLFFEECKFGLDEACLMADALKHNNGLQHLVLVRCAIGDEGAAAISDALKSNTSLRVLSLTDCGIGSRGAISLADCLRHNKSLKALRLYGNRIGDDGAEALVSVLKKENHSAVEVYIDHDLNLTTEEYARINESYGLVEACARKTEVFPEFMVEGLVDRALIPSALERIVRMDNLSILYSFVRKRVFEISLTPP